MSSRFSPKQVRWLAVCLGIVAVFACILALATPANRAGEVIQVVPITRITQSTEIVPVTQIVPVTEIVPSTQVVEVVQVVMITQVVEVSPTPPNPIAGVYFPVGRKLYRMNWDGSAPRIVAELKSSAEHSAISQNKLYYSTFDEEKIYAIDLLDPVNVSIFDSPGWGGQGLAIDPSGGKMYLGLYYEGVYAMDTTQAITWTQLVTAESLAPLLGQRGQLQIDPVRRHIYFRTAFNGDCDLCRYIWRVNFDGSNLTKIIPANGGDALALDLEARKLYFSDVPGNGTVKRANLDGSEPATLFAIPAPYSFCRSMVLDVAQKKIYISLFDADTGYKDRAIASLNMDGTEFRLLYQVTGNAGHEVSGDIALLR